MKNPHRHNLLAACSIVAALASMAPDLRAADTPEEAKPQASPGGPGMMGGPGMGPGMMGGYGMGPGMMGGYGMGPGMMGGYGMGPGMMGGMGMGPGMMGGWINQLNLSDEQQAKVNRIQDETRKKHWALMDAMMDQQARLRDLYAAPNRDSAAIDAAYKNFGKLHQQMYESAVDAHKRIEALLTKEQQEKLRTLWRRGGPGY